MTRNFINHLPGFFFSKIVKMFVWVVLITAFVVFVPSAYTLSSSSAQQDRPNIVIILTDDQDVDSLPVMRKLLSYPEGSWVKFNNAFISNSICCPSRATILTGQFSFHNQVVGNSTGNKLDDSNTLPVWLDRAGYRTGLVGKYLNGYPWKKGSGYVPPGWDFFKTSGFGGTVDGFTTSAVNFINDSTGPFFLFLSYHAPHEPADPPDRYKNVSVYMPPQRPNFNEGDVTDKPKWIRDLARLSTSAISDLRAERRDSQRELLAIDDGVERIVDALKAKGELDNTMLIFLGDNGIGWGAHRWIKKSCVYEECIRVPMLIRYPGLENNREENRLVSNVDLAATIIEYAGISPGLSQDGHSLIPVITNTAANWPDEIFLEVHSWTSKMTFTAIRVPGWVYVEYHNGDKELYDLAADPYQLRNRANKWAQRTIQAQLAQRLRALRGY